MPLFSSHLRTTTETSAQNRLSTRGWRYWFAYDHAIWLFYLVFWFVTPALLREPLHKWLLLLFTLVVFIAVYLLAHRGPPKFRPYFVLAAVLIGMLYVPVNQAAWGAFVFTAASMTEVSESTNVVIGLLLLQCAAVLAESWLLHLSPWLWSLTIGFTLFVGMNRLRMRQKGRADGRLRMAHEEIEHLAKTAERERIARDMHDVLGHSLSVIVLKSELAGRLMETHSTRAALEVAEIEAIARQALGEVRKTIAGYRSEGFASELVRAAQVLETAGVRLQKPAKPPYLPPRHEATLSLVLREAVTNIVRHAEASECLIVLSTNNDSTQLVIADDGRGDIQQEGSGLRGMRERVQELGGKLLLNSQRGTRLQIDLPQVVEQ